MSRDLMYSRVNFMSDQFISLFISYRISCYDSKQNTHLYVELCFFACCLLTEIIKVIRELTRLRRLDLSFMTAVDNSVLEAALSVMESDKTRRLFIRCHETAVDCDQFMASYKGERVYPGTGNYVYKNLEWTMEHTSFPKMTFNN